MEEEEAGESLLPFGVVFMARGGDELWSRGERKSPATFFFLATPIYSVLGERRRREQCSFMFFPSSRKFHLLGQRKRGGERGEGGHKGVPFPGPGLGQEVKTKKKV